MVALGLCRAQSQEGKCRDDLSLTCLSCEDSEEACCCRCPSAAWHQTLRSPACIYPHTHKVANLSPNSRLSVHGLHSRLWQELPDRDRHVGAKNGSLAEKCTRQKGENTEHAPHPGGGGGTLRCFSCTSTGGRGMATGAHRYGPSSMPEDGALAGSLLAGILAVTVLLTGLFL